MISKDWSTVSKAFIRSKNTAYTLLQLSCDSLHSSIKIMRADLQIVSSEIQNESC